VLAADYRLKTLFFGFKNELKDFSSRIMTSLWGKMIIYEFHGKDADLMCQL
jgi:hypothetical protein